MTSPAAWTTGYSADVELTLILNFRRVPLTAVGPHQVTARMATELAPGFGELEILVDGRCVAYPVELPLGSVPFDRRIPIRLLRPKGRDPAPLKPLPLPSDTEWYRTLETTAPLEADPDSP